MIVLLLRLYWEFLLIGMFSMGGGMATVPFLFDLSQRTAWFSTADLTTMIAISEATPGPIGVNMATYVGYITAGLPGGIVAPLGLTTPAFIIILLVSKIMNTLWQNPKVQGLFYALRPASVGLIAAAAFSVCAVSLFSTENGLTLHWPSILLFAVMLVAAQAQKPLHPLVHRHGRRGRRGVSHGGLAKPHHFQTKKALEPLFGSRAFLVWDQASTRALAMQSWTICSVSSL